MLWKFPTEANRIAIIEPGGKIYTYEQLQIDVQSMSEKIQTKRKVLILLLARNDYNSLLGYLASLHTNHAVMLLNADLDKNLLETIIHTYKPTTIMGSYPHNDYAEVEEGFWQRQVAPEYEIHPDLAVLLSTSGTTGSIKFVRLSYSNILANAKSIAEYLQITKDDRGLANLPFHYSYGLSIINSHLFAGATILLTNEGVLTKSFWEFMEKEKATSFAGVPYTYQILQRINFQKMDLPALRYFTQAGGRLNEKLVRLFGEYAKEHEKKFYVMYGQTEATARISYVPPEALLQKSSSIGKPIPDGMLSIDPETEELLYEGPNVMLGYATHFMDLAKGDELQGKLHTGDLAEVDEEGYFYIKGRMKRFIKLFGLRLNLDDIEKQIELKIQSAAVCVGTDDKMVVVVHEEKYKDTVQCFVENVYKLHRSAFRVKVLEEIPRLSNGKVHYDSLKELVI
ncbi:AMP-binding protein [Bacillus sp. CGMCC 1.16607]|uniref:AMP-binding protein n=1 Tax=Bacillus sp. CGMCC 1.16607 TaxID=3351842 RepID=UPI003642D425